jgi:hypothetical protein
VAAGRLVLGAADPAINADGTLAVGATLTVYETGTTTLATIYAESGLTTTISNPQTANAAGQFYEQSTTIWADATVGYDVVLTYPDGTSNSYEDVFLLGSAGGSGAYMPISGGTFTGPVYGLTPAANDDSTEIPNTSWVDGELETYALLASPSFSGTPTAPNPPIGDDSEKLATTNFVTESIAAGAAISAYAYITISGGVVTVQKNVGFTSIVRSSAGAFNFTFSAGDADANYVTLATVTNTTALVAVTPSGNRTTTGFAVSVVTPASNVPTDPVGLSVLVIGT